MATKPRWTTKYDTIELRLAKQGPKTASLHAKQYKLALEKPTFPYLQGSYKSPNGAAADVLHHHMGYSPNLPNIGND